jgi:hypothetical protein
VTSRNPAKGADEPVRVLYIGGLGRSGSTLLERSLGELPDACPVGELVHLWERGLLLDELCGCGLAFSSCPFWSEVGRVAFGGWDQLDVRSVLDLKHSVDRTRFVPILLSPVLRRRRRQDLTEYNALYREVYRAVLQVSGRRFVVDSSKHASLAFCLRRSKDIRVRFLHVVRDSRGVAYSWSKAVRRPEAGNAYMPTYSPARVALHWNTFNLLFWILRLLGEPVQMVRYEDFVAAPVDTIRCIARHAGSAGSEQLAHMQDFDVDLSLSHTVAGNPMRFRTGRIVIRPDDGWRTEMPRGRRRLVGLLTLPLRSAYGYVGTGRQPGRVSQGGRR